MLTRLNRFDIAREASKSPEPVLEAIDLTIKAVLDRLVGPVESVGIFVQHAETDNPCYEHMLDSYDGHDAIRLYDQKALASAVLHNKQAILTVNLTEQGCLDIAIEWSNSIFVANTSRFLVDYARGLLEANLNKVS